MYYLCGIILFGMVVKFDKTYLEELYYKGKCSDKKHRFQPNIIKIYKRRIELLESVPCYGFCPTHPGEILKEELEYRGISQRSLASTMGLSYSVVNEIVNGQRSLTPFSALMFETALGVEADTLMRMQLKYNMQTARKDKKIINRLNEIRKMASLF